MKENEWGTCSGSSGRPCEAGGAFRVRRPSRRRCCCCWELTPQLSSSRLVLGTPLPTEPWNVSSLVAPRVCWCPPTPSVFSSPLPCSGVGLLNITPTKGRGVETEVQASHCPQNGLPRIVFVPSLFLYITHKLEWRFHDLCGGSFSPGGPTWIRIFLLPTRGCVLSGAQLTDLTAVILSAPGKHLKTERGVKRGEEWFITITHTADYESYYSFTKLDSIHLLLPVFSADTI